jgi:hypothetical protein
MKVIKFLSLALIASFMLVSCDETNNPTNPQLVFNLNSTAHKLD